ncbi:uncharacterized protein LOC113464942 isoform X2 [Ceratina calcarata]|uniref:Uncharacterized protein LOC113464942 isoform X2 n=1 Tax=Ceratina calcarata TaxID=156304 RepID=A0AAJ7SA74_9HYME|nr:uncharacterized protein LOC113464942 isoform X2 [Ceratina calcarata]
MSLVNSSASIISARVSYTKSNGTRTTEHSQPNGMVWRSVETVDSFGMNWSSKVRDFRPRSAIIFGCRLGVTKLSESSDASDLGPLRLWNHRERDTQGHTRPQVNCAADGTMSESSGQRS